MNDESMRAEWMTNKSNWDPSKLDDIAGASDLSISQFSPVPADAIDPFYTTQGDIRATKSDSNDESNGSGSPKDPGTSNLTKDPVVNDTSKDPAAYDSLKDPVDSDSKKESSQYRPKPKKEKKRKKENESTTRK